MATKVLPQKLLQKNLKSRFFLTTRLLNSTSSSCSAVTPLNLTEKPDPTAALDAPPCAIITKAGATAPTLLSSFSRSSSSSSILDLQDHRRLFETLPTTRLLRSSVNLHLAAMEPMVDFGMWVMNSKLMEVEVLREAVMATIRHTFYEHFCAGENTVEAGKSVLRLNEAGLRGMLDFAVEFTSNNDACDRNLDGFLQTIASAKSLPPSSVSFVIVKVTAICPLSLLERVSDLLRWQQKDPSFNLPWKETNFPIFADSSPLYHTLKKPEPLTPQEEHDLQLGQQRFWNLCQKCVEANIPLMVDAEHTLVQPAIDYLTYLSATKYNRDNNPIVYNTIQAYLKDAKERLLLATKVMDKMGVPMGFKLVRGAYMSSERKIASSLGYDSPIHNTIQQTHACYNDCASFLLEKIAAEDSHGLVLATHNVESARLAATKAQDLGIGNGHQKLEFAQLCGMSEALSYGLRNAGFLVSKYMPFGPIDVVMPYLLRRAEENRGMLSASSIDRQLMRNELKRRLIAAVV